MSAFLDALDGADKALWATAFLTGLRRGELAALRWEDVEALDGDGPLGGWLHVRHSWDVVEGLTSTKSRRGTRRVPFPRALSARLAEQRELGTGDYVFGTFAVRYEGRAAKALKALNKQRASEQLEPIPTFTIHGARHSFGALLRAAGVSMDDAADYLGHARNIGVTGRYTSAIEIDARDADNAAKLTSYLARINTGDRIDQLVTTEPVGAEELARELVERYGADTLAKIAELVAVEAR